MGLSWWVAVLGVTERRQQLFILGHKYTHRGSDALCVLWGLR